MKRFNHKSLLKTPKSYKFEQQQQKVSNPLTHSIEFEFCRLKYPLYIYKTS